MLRARQYRPEEIRSELGLGRNTRFDDFSAPKASRMPSQLALSWVETWFRRWRLIDFP